MSEIIQVAAGTPAALCVAGWIETEWPGIPIINWLRQPIDEGCALPLVLAWQASDDEELCGCGALLNDDMNDRPLLNPWLGCLYVTPRARRQGIGRSLLQALVKKAVEIKIPMGYLFCSPELSPFYESEGWETIENRLYEGKASVIMNRRFYAS